MIVISIMYSNGYISLFFWLREMKIREKSGLNFPFSFSVDGVEKEAHLKSLFV